MTVVLSGQANDYVGKGMHGGFIAIAPPAGPTGNQNSKILNAIAPIGTYRITE
jgi:glutamate synthase (ferredoxin)